MKGQGIKAFVEGVKLVVRLFIFFGLPAMLTELMKVSPKLAVVVGTVLTFIDKVIHKLPNQYNGLLGF